MDNGNRARMLNSVFRTSKDLRVSDADRESVAEFLKAHFTDGRLTDDELDERVAATYRARRESELLALTADLPRFAAPAPAPPPRWRTMSVRSVVAVLVALVCTVVLLDAMPPEMLALFFVITVPMLMMAAVMLAPFAVGALGLMWIMRIVRGAQDQRPVLPAPRRQRWLA